MYKKASDIKSFFIFVCSINVRVNIIKKKNGETSKKYFCFYLVLIK